MTGFPDFTEYVDDEIKSWKLTGEYKHDEKIALERSTKYSRTPKGMVWHHVEGGVRMQLVPKDIHLAVNPHTGGAAQLKGLRKRRGLGIGRR